MINTVAKILLGLAAVAFVMALGAAAAAGNYGAFVLLFGVAVAFTFAAVALIGSGFSDRAPRFSPSEDAPPVQMVSVGPSQAARPSPWPLAGAISVGLVAIGLALGSGLVIIGVVCGLLAAAGWLAQAWREDPTYTATEASRVASRLLAPVGLPVMALGLIAVIVVSVSRVLLTLPRFGSIGTAFALSVVLLATFFTLSTRPHLARNSLVFLGGFAVVAVVTAGSVSAANGYRTFEVRPAPGPIRVVAHNTAFNVKTITVTEGQPTTMTFDNLDAIYHNVAVYDKNGTPEWDGQPVDRKKIIYVHTFDMPAGTYTFRCDFHPTSMVGTFVVKAAPTASTTEGAP